MYSFKSAIRYILMTVRIIVFFYYELEGRETVLFSSNTGGLKYP